MSVVSNLYNIQSNCPGQVSSLDILYALNFCVIITAPAVYYALTPNRPGIKRQCCLTSVAYIGPKSRTERPRKTKIGTGIAHITPDSDTTFKVKCQGHQASLLTVVLTCSGAWERIERGNLLLRCSLQAWSARRREARRLQREERGGGTLWRPPTQLVCSSCCCCWRKISVTCPSND